MSNAFVRGGQLSLHSLRMLKQVFVVLYKWGIVLMSLIIIWYCFIKITGYEIKMLYWYSIAQIMVDMKQGGHVFLIEDAVGNEFTINAASLINNPKAIKVISHLYAVLLQAVKIAGYTGGTAFIILTGIFLKTGGKFSKDQDVRGNTLIEQKTLIDTILKDNKKEKYQAYLLGKIPYPAYSEMQHTLIAGSTGSGKTILISDLIAQIKQRGDKAIIFDKMGVYTERFYSPEQDILLNPFDKRSHNWSIFNEVNHEANFDAIASALIPFEKSNADPFWTKAARTLFSEVCSSLFKKGGVSNSKLVNTLLKKDLTQAAKLVKGTAAQAIIDPQSPKTALSVMSILATYLKCLKFLKDDGQIFSIKDWVKDEQSKACIFISSTGDLHPTLTPLISAWIEVVITNILSLPRSRDRKIWVILDELPSLHTLPSLEQGLAETRQFGGCFVLSIQSISQLRDRYGMNNAQTISSLCNNKIFLRAGDHDSARWYSDNIGSVEIEEYREGLSYGSHEMRDGINLHRQKQHKSLVLPSELINLKDKQGYFCMAKGCPVAKVEFDYHDWPKLNEKLDEVTMNIGKKEQTKIDIEVDKEDNNKANIEENKKISTSEALYDT